MIKTTAEGVVVPHHLARPVLALLVRAYRDLAQSSGGHLPIRGDVVELMRTLNSADENSMSDSGQTEGEFDSVSDAKEELVDWLCVKEAGMEVGYSARQVRRLCAAGVVEAKRVGGRSYLVNVESLKDHLRS